MPSSFSVVKRLVHDQEISSSRSWSRFVRGCAIGLCLFLFLSQFQFLFDWLLKKIKNEDNLGSVLSVFSRFGSYFGKICLWFVFAFSRS